MSYLNEYIENWAPDSVKTLYYRLEALIPLIASTQGRLMYLKATNSLPSEIKVVSEQLDVYRTEYTNIHKRIIDIKTKKKVVCGWEKSNK